MSNANVTIPLDEPIISHGEPIREVIVREPTFQEYLRIGEPYTIAQTPEGAPLVVENLDAIRGYVEACVIQPKDQLLLEKAGFRVARKLRGTVMSFFLPGGPATEGSLSSPKNSSSPGSEASQPTLSGA